MKSTKEFTNKKRWTNIVSISLAGMIIIAIIAYSFNTSMNITTKYVPHLDTTASIKLEITTSHIWFEELLMGDVNNSMDSVVKGIEKANWYIDTLLEGREDSEKAFLPVQDQKVRNKINKVKEKLVTYRNITEKRYREMQTSAAGSEIDQNYDATFLEIIRGFDEVETILLRIIKEDTNKFHIMEWVLICGIVTITLITCLVFYKHDLRKENDFLSMQQIVEKLEKEKMIRLESEKSIKHLASFPEKNINPILEVDSSGSIIFYNIAVTNLLKNLNLDEDLSVFLPDDFNEIQKRLEQKDEVQLYREVKIKGLVFGEHLHVIPEFHVIRIYTRDITEEKRVEVILKNEREKFYSILDSIPAFIYLQNKDYSINYANRYFKDHFGDPYGILCHKVLWNRNEPCPKCPTFKVFDTKKPQVWEWDCAPDSFVYQVHDYPFIDIDGQFCVLELGIDITTRKRMEEEGLHTQKLESLGILAGGIAHDFNNILTAIIGNMQLAILCSKEEDKIYHNLITVEKAAIRAKDLTQQLQTFSKGGAPVKKKTSIENLIKDTVGFSLKGSNIICSFLISDNLSGVEIDEGQVSQVINNLVINAVQAMPKGGNIDIKVENVTVDESTNTSSLEKGHYVDITVKDNGTGIKKEHIKNIFDPYFTTKTKGSGLGLASSFSIIKQHNGLITVDSKVGFGTTFHVYLPALSEKLANGKMQKAAILVGKGKILIMDDEQMIRDLLKAALTNIGYTVECVKNEKEVIDKYTKSLQSKIPFDVVVLDLIIPGDVGGEDIMRKLQDIDPKVKGVVFSGYSENSVMSKYAEYGFMAAVKKPFKIEEIHKVLQKVINA